MLEVVRPVASAFPLAPYSFSIIFAIMPAARQFGYRKKRLSWVKLGKRGPPNHFLTVVAEAAHNLGEDGLVKHSCVIDNIFNCFSSLH